MEPLCFLSTFLPDFLFWKHSAIFVTNRIVQSFAQSKNHQALPKSKALWSRYRSALLELSACREMSSAIPSHCHLVQNVEDFKPFKTVIYCLLSLHLVVHITSEPLSPGKFFISVMCTFFQLFSVLHIGVTKSDEISNSNFDICFSLPFFLKGRRICLALEVNGPVIRSLVLYFLLPDHFSFPSLPNQPLLFIYLSHLLPVLLVHGSSSLLVYIFTSVLVYVGDVLFLFLFVLPLFLFTCCQILPFSLLFLFCLPFGTIAFLSPADNRKQLSKRQNYASVHTLCYF